MPKLTAKRWLVNKRAAREYAIKLAHKRSEQFTRFDMVSIAGRLDEVVRDELKRIVAKAPILGKTIRA